MFPIPTTYMLTSFIFSLLIWGIFSKLLLKQLLIFLKSWISTSWFSIFIVSKCFSLSNDNTYVRVRADSHWVPSPKSQFTWGRSVQSQLLRAWKVGLTTSHMVRSLKSQVWHGCLYGNAFWRWGLQLVLRVGSSKKIDPTCNTSLKTFCIK